VVASLALRLVGDERKVGHQRELESRVRVESATAPTPRGRS
jgi:beta-xylosidase